MKNLSKSTKIILAVVAVIVLVGGLALGIYLSSQEQDTRSDASPATTLVVSPSSQSKLPGQSVAFTVLMDTGPNQVTGVDLELTYDPTVLEIENVIKGSGISVFDQITKSSTDPDAGTISYSAFTASAASSVKGPSLEALRVSARVLDTAEAGNYTLGFAATTSVTGVNNGGNVLISNTPGSLAILAPANILGDPVSSGPPSATPSGTATATPSGTATASPTATPDTLIDAGVSLPTLLNVVMGIGVILGSLLLVF